MAEIRKSEAVKVLCLEDRGAPAALASLYERLGEFLAARNVPGKRERLALFYGDPKAVDPGDRHFAAAVELGGEVNGDGEVIVVLLPSGLLACEQHRGAYAGIPEAYARLLAWAAEHGYRPAGPAREYYLEGFAPAGGEEALTEIQLPVEPVGA